MRRNMKFTYAMLALMLSALGAALHADHTSYGFDISVTPAIAAPAVSGLSVSTGSNLAPVTITVTGSNFFAGLSTSTVTEVKLGNTILAGYTAVNDSTITGVVIPSGLNIGINDVTVAALGGTSVTSSADQFTVTTSAPSVSGLSASSGSNLNPVTISVNGTGFFGGLTSNTVTAVKLGTLSLVYSPASNDSTISGVVIPSGLALGTYDITVAALGGTSVTLSADQFTVTTPAPTVASLSTATGTNLAPVTISVNGTGFFGGIGANTVTSVKLGTLALALVAATDDSTITGIIIPSGLQPNTYNLTVVALGGTSVTSSADQFIVTTLAPSVSSLSASSGSNLNPVTISVSGTGFFGGIGANTVTSVKLGTLALALVSASDDSTIPGVVIPSGLAIGTYDITVTALGGTSVTSSADQYAIATSVPVVSSLSVSSGSNLNPVTVTVSGSGFFGGLGSSTVSSVKLGNLALSTGPVSDTSIAGVIIPGGQLPGTYNITVTALGGTSVTSSADQFTVTTPAPSVSSLSVSSGSNLAPVTINVSGTGFFGGVGSNTVTAVKLGTTALAPVLASSDSTITGVVIPAGFNIGTYDVTVTALGGTSVTLSADQFTVTTPAPSVSSLSVSTGSNLAPVTISISGTGYFGGLSSSTVSAVKIGTLSISYNAASNDSTITGVVIPSGLAIGTYDITLTALGGNSPAVSQDVFTVTTDLPVVSAITPASGSNLANATVSISGTGFFAGSGSSAVTAIKIGTTPITTYFVADANSITGAVIPAGLTAGTYDIQVSTLAGTSVTAAGDIFVTVNKAVVTGITPSSGSNLGSVTITATGASFFGGGSSSTVTAVSLGAFTLSTYDASNDSTLTAVVPAGFPVGTYNLLVTANGVQTDPDSGNAFAITTPAPSITALSISAASNVAPVTVTITGSGFFGGVGSNTVSAVRIGTHNMSSYSVTDDTIASAVIPAGLLSGTYDVTLAAAGGTSAITIADKFIVTANPPVVSGLSVSTHSNLTAVTITVTGSNFWGGVGSNTVTGILLGTQALALSAANSDSTLPGVVIPAGIAIGTYDLTVTALGGTSLTSSNDKFTVTTTVASPIINAVTSPTNITIQLLTGTKATIANAIKVNGSTTGVSILSSTTWQASVNLNEGNNSFSVTALDAVGDESTAATTAILLDTIPPAAPVIAAVTSPTNITTQMLTGTKVTDAAAIKVNGSTTGVSILSSTTWQASVNLNEGNNSFSVTAVDAVGNSSSAATTAILLDTIPPAVPVIAAVTSPTNITTQMLTGTKVTDAAAIKVNGSTTGVSILSSTTWQASVNLTEGNNSLSVTALDAVGNSSSAATTAILLDTIPPAVPVIAAVTSPTNITTQMLTGTKETDAAAIKVNGSTTGVSILSSTTWQASVNLNEGNNSFSVTALDAVGNSSSAATTAILLDTIPPAVPVIAAVTSPTNITTQMLTGTKASDASVIKVNGGTTGVSILSSTTWQAAVNLTEGNNGFSVTALDAVGNSSSAATTAILLDTIPPAVPVIAAVTSPTNITTQMLTGTKVTDAAAIKVNGSTTGVSILSSTTWQAAVNLNEGNNSFSVTAVDAVGNSSSAATTAILLDTIPPAVPVIAAVTSPTNITTQMLTGTKVTDAAAIKVNGSTTGVSILSSTTWQASVNLTEGNNSFSVTALDAVGNSSTAATTAILLDTIPPAVPVINAVTSPTSITTQLLSGTKVTDAASIKVNGSTTGVSIVSSTTWQKTVNLVLGVNNFSVTALDAVGNESTAATTAITLNSPVPSVSSLSVATGMNTSPVTITIGGSGFFGGAGSNTVTSVKIGTLSLVATYFVQNDSSITGAVIPPGVYPGTYDIFVAALGGTSLTSAADHFIVTAPLPAVTAVTPNNGSNTGPVTVSLSGSGFFGGMTSNTVTSVKIGTYTVAASYSVSDTSITGVVIQSGLSPATYNITVTALGGTSVTTSSNSYTVTGAGVTVSSLSVTTGSNLAPVNISVYGGGFWGGVGYNTVSSVKLGTLSLAAGYAVPNDSTITGAIIPAGLMIGTYDVTVAALGGTSATSSADKYTVTTPAPAVTSLSVTSGTNTSPVTVTIGGSGFFGGLPSNTVTSVKFGTTTIAASYNVGSDSSITNVVINAGFAPGIYDITVAALGGTSATVVADRFTVTAGAVSVSSVNPNTGSNLAARTVTVSGAGFWGGVGSNTVTFVKLGTLTLAAGYAVPNDSTITGAVIPPGLMTGTYDITVNALGGTSVTTAGDKYIVTTLPPAVTSLSVSTGSNLAPVTINLNGTGFFGGLPANTVTAVKLGTSTIPASYSVNSDSSITNVIINAGFNPGTYDITVTALGGTSVTAAGDKFTVTTPVPVVSSLTPTTGSNINPVTITITGSGFFGGIGTGTVTAVKIGTISLGTFFAAYDNILGVVVPAGTMIGTYDLTVTASGGTSVTNSSDKYTETTPAPAVTSLSVTAGTNSSPVTITIGGSGFFGGMTTNTVTAVKFGTSTIAASYTVGSDSSITNVVINAGFAPGVYDITVTALGGTSSTVLADRYTVSTAAPVVSSLSVTSGFNTNPVTITVGGSGFWGGVGSNTVTSVKLGTNTIPATYIVGSDSSITGVVIPQSLSPAVYNMTVAALGGTSVTTSSNVYTVKAAAVTVTSLSVSSGLNTAPVTLNITGAGYFGGVGVNTVTAVKLGSITLVTYTVASDVSITGVVIPSGNFPGTYDITVAALGGTSSTVAGDRFTVTAPAPAVTSLSPTFGPTGTSINISGTNFYAGTGVSQVTALSISGTAITSFSVFSDVSITSAIIPAGLPVANTYNILVSTTGGTSTISSSTKFTVTPARPVVSSITPANQQVNKGVTVTITGTGFFGGTGTSNVTAVSLSSGSTTITINYGVPAIITDTSISGAVITNVGLVVGNYDVFVSVGNGAGTNLASSLKFSVTGLNVSLTAAAPASVPNGKSVTITANMSTGGVGTSSVTLTCICTKPTRATITGITNQVTDGSGNAAFVISSTNLTTAGDYTFSVIGSTSGTTATATGDFMVAEAPKAGDVSVAGKVFTPGKGLNNKVVFSYTSTPTDNVELSVYTLKGRLIRKLTFAPGATVQWDGTDASGNVSEGGILLWKLKTGSKVSGGTIVIAK